MKCVKETKTCFPQLPSTFQVSVNIKSRKQEQSAGAEGTFAGWSKCRYRPTLAICPNHVLLCSVAAFPHAEAGYSLWGLLRQNAALLASKSQAVDCLFSPLPRIQRFSISAFIAFRLTGKLSGKKRESLVSQPAKAFTNHGCIQDSNTRHFGHDALLGKRSPCTLTLAGSPIQKHNWLEVCKLNHCARNFL